MELRRTFFPGVRGPSPWRKCCLNEGMQLSLISFRLRYNFHVLSQSGMTEPEILHASCNCATAISSQDSSMRRRRSSSARVRATATAPISMTVTASAVASLQSE
jgi:hypothetical protein